MKSIKLGCIVVIASALGGCGSDSSSTNSGVDQNAALTAPGQPLPTASGTFPGHYVVPAPPPLAAAARYSVDQVDWIVEHGIATLRYYLPVGLVGGSLEVEFSGSLRPGATTVTLKSAGGGTSTCTALGTTVTCQEIFGDLGPLPISMKVVTAYAAQEYPGPAEDRVAVANLFSSDPIGFVNFNVARHGE
jgi:hypothetical protein